MASLPLKQNQIKLPQCPICIEQYNLARKRPYYICRNSHSICKHCYHQHKFINSNNFCPICKCQMNLNYRQNSDIITLLTFHQLYADGKNSCQTSRTVLNNSKMPQDYTGLNEKFRIPRVIQIALLLTCLCVFPLIFVLISQLSYIIINAEKTLTIFVYESVISLIETIWRVIWAFMQGFHSTCETLFIYSIIFHMIYVVHMILITFSLVFVLKLCSQKFISEQWKMKGKDLRQIELPKNQVQRICFIVLIRFIKLADRLFQIEVKNDK